MNNFIDISNYNFDNITNNRQDEINNIINTLNLALI